MRSLLNYFLRGLVFVAPVVLSIWVVYTIFVRVDGLLGLPIPGVGFLATVALITFFGFLASNLLTRSLVGVIDRVFERLPFVRLLYGSTRDLVNAFVGERRRFDTPVLVTFAPGSGIRAVGFVTQASLEHLGMSESVAVYLPHSYTFAGNLLVVPSSQVEPLPADAAEALAFVVSGGVTDAGAKELAPR